MAPEERLIQLLAGLEASVGTLERYAVQVPRERLLSDVDAQNMVLFALYRAAQDAVDVANHLLAARALGAATSYQDAFQRLVDAGLLSADLGGRLRAWAGFRNVIAHLYREIDLELVHRAYAEDAGDLRDLVAAVRAAL